MNKTNEQFDQIISKGKNIFEKKIVDYGAAWRILRLPSLTDQILIKANRIRSLETKQIQKIDENPRDEFIGILNYSIIALIQLELGFANQIDITNERAITLYDTYAKKARDLMEMKNHDYNEAWRSMRISSFTDLIIMKLFRIKQIEDNEGKTIISEGIDANYYDIINYSIFALIKFEYNEK